LTIQYASFLVFLVGFSTLIENLATVDSDCIFKHQLRTVMESYIMEKIYTDVYPWFSHIYHNYDIYVVSSILRFQFYTQDDLGIPCEFQCPQTEAINTLLKLSLSGQRSKGNRNNNAQSTTSKVESRSATSSDVKYNFDDEARTPVDILLTFKDTINVIKDTVENNVKTKFPVSTLVLLTSKSVVFLDVLVI